MHKASLAAVAALALALTGCVASPDDSPDEAAPTPTSSGLQTPTPTSSVAGISMEMLEPDDEVPTFETPWAAEFTEAYLGSTSDVQRTVLEDGEITEEEADMLEDELRDCLTDQGFTDITFHGAGAFGERPPADMTNEEHYEVLLACQEASWGSTAADAYYLYYRIERNPDHEDETAIMAKCLIRQGLVTETYTADDYAEDAATDEYPFDTSATKFQACLLSPLAVDGT